MRRLLTLAAFLLIIAIVPVCAQRSSGHSSGGSHGSVGGGHASFGGHVSSGGSFGGHAGFVGPGAGYSGGHYGAGSRPGSRTYGHSGGVRIRTYGVRNRFGYGYRYGYPYGYSNYGYPYYGYAGIDPYWWWDTYPSESEAQQRAEANEMNQENLEEQQALREQDEDAYARPMPRPRQAPAASQQAENDPATVIVFRDQHQREVKNYAIVNEMLWIFTPQRIEKVPLAILDVPATIKANEDRGVDFRLPESGEGQ